MFATTSKYRKKQLKQKNKYNYCHSHNDWGPQKQLSTVFVPVYFWKTAEKPETDPQLLWEWQYVLVESIYIFIYMYMKPNYVYTGTCAWRTAILIIIEGHETAFNGMSVCIIPCLTILIHIFKGLSIDLTNGSPQILTNGSP